MKSMKQWMILFVVGFFCTAGIQMFAASEAGAGIGIESSKNNQIQSKSMMSRAAGAVSYAQNTMSQAANYMMGRYDTGVKDINHFIQLSKPSEINGDYDEFIQNYHIEGQDGLLDFLQESIPFDESMSQAIYIKKNEAGDDKIFAELFAKKAGVNIIYVDADDFVIDGVAKIQKLFDEIDQKSPCVIFIDNAYDFYCFGQPRKFGTFLPYYKISQEEIALEKNIDLLKSKQKKVLIFLGCVCDFSSSLYLVDEKEAAVVEPYFKVTKTVSLQTILSKEYRLSEDQIVEGFQIALHAQALSADVDIVKLARLIVKAYEYTIGEGLHYPKTNYDFKRIVMQAQKYAIQYGHDKINMKDLEDACQTFAFRFEDNDLDYESAIHEAGHALVGILLTQSFQILHSVSIERSLNIALPILQNDSSTSELRTLDQHKNNISFLFGGVVAEQILGPKASLYDYIRKQKFDVVDFINFEESGSILNFQDSYLDEALIEQTVQIIIDKKLTDQSKIEILQECYQRAVSLIQSHKKEVKKIADLLRKKGVVSGDEIYAVLNVSKPLYDFEQGPLPKDLVGNYALRDAHAIAKKQELAALSKKLQDVGMPYVLLQDINQKDADGYTQLSIAILLNNKEAVKLLLDAGVDIVDINSSHTSECLQYLEINSVYKSQEEIDAMKNLVERYKDRYHAEKSKKIVIA